MNLDQTVLLTSGQCSPAQERCPVCDAELQADENDAQSLRCPVCSFVKRQKKEIGPGDIIGNKYRILSHLISGGVGKLFLCHPLDDVGVRYVLKILKTNDPVSRQRFRREADILASINCNDNIAKLIDVWEGGEGVFIIMEYVDGKNLRQLKQEYVFDEIATLQIAQEVAKTLSAILESHGIIHRDIKPENIMLNKDFQLKLLDFGLSKQFGHDTCTDITMANIGLGTPGYMSPEQFKDAKNVDFRSDIFSLGATMFYLLTGEKPFAGETPMEIYQNTLTNTPPLVYRFEGKCSLECISLIRRMMRPSPTDRYSTYSDLLSDIEELLNRNQG